jgi:hypothetical protein
VNETILAKRTAISSARENWRSGWNQGRTGIEDSEWARVRLVGFCGVGNNRVHAVVVRNDGVVKDVALDEIRFPAEES